MGMIAPAADAVQIFGIDNLGPNNAGTVGDRLIRFDSANPLGTVVNIGSTGFLNEGMSGLEFSGAGVLYATSGFHTGGASFSGSRLYTINPGTGQAALIAPMGLPPGTSITDLSWNPVSGQMLGLGNSGSINSLHNVNLMTGQATLIGNITGIPGAPLDIGLASNNAGVNYVHDIATDRMYILAGTVASALPQVIGVNTNFSQGMTINWRGANEWYLAAIGNTPSFFSDIRQINNLTGATQAVLGTWPNNGAGGIPQYELGDIAIMSSGPANLIWNGLPPNNQWNNNPANMNWLSGPMPAAFMNGDIANFTDNAVSPVQIDPMGVAPQSTNVSNTMGVYLFLGGPINGNGSLTKTGAGELVLQNLNNFTGGVFINGGVVTVFDNGNLGAASAGLNFNGGRLRISSASFSSNRNVNVGTSGGSVDTGSFNASMTGPITGPGTLTKAGGSLFDGILSVTNVRSAGLNVAQGELMVLPGAANNMPSGVTDVETLTIAGGPLAPTARLNLTNNGMIVGSTPTAEGGPEAETEIRGLISSGYAGGSWGGQGIASTSADFGSGHFALGYAEAGSIGVMNFLTFPVLPTDTLIRFTRYGDTQLDGVVNLIDFNNLASNFGNNNAVWRQGDFNYDMIVNLFDFNLLASNFGTSASPDGPTPADWAALASAVPEPGGALVLALAGAALVRRRRRA